MFVIIVQRSNPRPDASLTPCFFCKRIVELQNRNLNAQCSLVMWTLNCTAQTFRTLAESSSGPVPLSASRFSKQWMSCLERTNTNDRTSRHSHSTVNSLITGAGRRNFEAKTLAKTFAFSAGLCTQPVSHFKAGTDEHFPDLSII